jgi:hypothetical protein
MVALLILASPAAAQSGPFGSLAGEWTGGGTITLGGGTRERIRCRADYNVSEGGSLADISLRCASDSYSFELRGRARYYPNGEVKGNWSERTRSMAGNLSGSAKGGQFDVRVEGQTFAALLSLTTRGNQQSISIKTAGGDNQMSEASLTLSRRG